MPHPPAMANQNQETMISLRATAAQAFAFVKGSEAIETFSAYSFEEALGQQVERLEGGGDATLGAVAQIEKIQSDLSKVKQALANAPATVEEALEDPDDNVNTPE